MGASFRSTSQITDLAGCDRLTISPKLIEQLTASYEPISKKLSYDNSAFFPGVKPYPMTEEEFMKMYGSQTWDNMSRADQQAARKLYGFSTSHGDSMTGGAFHMVAERER